MARHCETLIMGKQQKMSDLMSAQQQQESLTSFSPRNRDDEANMMVFNPNSGVSVHEVLLCSSKSHTFIPLCVYLQILQLLRSSKFQQGHLMPSMLKSFLICVETITKLIIGLMIRKIFLETIIQGDYLNLQEFNLFHEQNFTVNSHTSLLGNVPMLCSTEYQHQPDFFRLPASSPYDNFLKAAGC